MKWIVWLLSMGLASAQAPMERVVPDLTEENAAEVARAACAFLVSRQEKDQWPYDSGHRVLTGRKAEIQIGYRVGGTAFCAMSLLLAPGYAKDAARQAAVRRATGYVTRSIRSPLLAHSLEDFEKIYTADVPNAKYVMISVQRNWAYAYGLLYLLQLRALERVPEGMAKDVDSAIRFFLKGLEKTELPEKQGRGWAYMNLPMLRTALIVTAPTLQALFEAKRQGFAFDAGMLERGIGSLVKARTAKGTYPYVGNGGMHATKPSSLGRMLACESVLFLCGKSDAKKLRAALAAFFEHWSALEARRGKTDKVIKGGTHGKKYGIAPYYFFYAHYYASLAIQLLPEGERARWRERLLAKFREVQLPDGTWSDRPSFLARGKLYGTAVALCVLTMRESPPFLTRFAGEKRK